MQVVVMGPEKPQTSGKFQAFKAPSPAEVIEHEHRKSSIKKVATGQASNVLNSEKSQSQESDVVSIQDDDVIVCRSPDCKKREPHVHAVKNCVTHAFCATADFEEVADDNDRTTLPLPMRHDVNRPSDQVKRYEQILSKKRGAVQLKEMGLKCVVTEYALAQWYAQSFGLEAGNLPIYPPSQFDIKEFGENKGQKAYSQVTTFLKKFDKVVKKERDFSEHVRKLTQEGVTQTGQSGELADMMNKEMEKKEKDAIPEEERAHSMMMKMKPMVYPLNKTVKRFDDPTNLGREGGKSSKYYAYSRGDRENSAMPRQSNSKIALLAGADESLSASSMEETGSRLMRQSTSAGKHANASMQGEVKKRAADLGFESIREECTVQVSGSASKTKQDNSGMSPNRQDAKSASKGRQAAQQVHPKVSKEPRQPVYNPYASEPIKHFADLSRAEIDKLMVKMKKARELKKLQREKRENAEGKADQSGADPKAKTSDKQQPTETKVDIKPRAVIVRKRAMTSDNLAALAQVTKPFGQSDISMRARREQQFRETMAAKHNVNVRQGRTYSKIFNRQIESTENGKGVEGTCFQYINQFQDIKGLKEITLSQPELVRPAQQLQAAQTVKSPEKKTKIPITANLIQRLKQKRQVGVRRGGSATVAASDQLAFGSRNNGAFLNQDQASNSLMSYQTSRRPHNALAGGQQNDNQKLGCIINKKHQTRDIHLIQFQTGSVASQSFVDRGRSTGASFSQSMVQMMHPQQQQPLSSYTNTVTSFTSETGGFPRQSKSQARVKRELRNVSLRQGDGGIHSSARRQIKEMLDSQFLNQDLRKQSHGHPYTNAKSVFATTDRRRQQQNPASLTASPQLMQDFATLSAATQSKTTALKSSLLQSAHGFQGDPSPLPVSHKRVNQVSFVNPGDMDRAMNETLSGEKDLIRAVTPPGVGFGGNSGALKAKPMLGEDGSGDESKNQENLTTNASNLSEGKQLKSPSGYFVTPEDYNFEVNEPAQYFQKELYVKLPLWEPIVQKSKAEKELDIFKSAEFWLSKGYGIQSRAHAGGNRKNANEADNVALDYYLSGVKIDPQHYGCIYNSGCCHFFTGKYENARKWFHLTTLVNSRCPLGYYGKALACLKLGLYEEALQSVLQIDYHEEVQGRRRGAFAASGENGGASQIEEGLDDVATSSSQASIAALKMEPCKDLTKEQITFLHAVCCKILNRQDQAQVLYQKLKSTIYMTQCKKMVMRTFAVILVPLQKDRNVTEDNITSFCSAINLYDEAYLNDSSVAANLGKLTTSQPEMQEQKRLAFLAHYLHTFSFFKRIPLRRLAEVYIHRMKFLERKKDQLVVIPAKGQVQIVLNGQVVLREHQLNNPGDFSIKQIAKVGHIMFAPELDLGNSNQPLVWPVVYSTQAQLAMIDRATFDSMWKESRDRDLEVALSQLNLHVFFKSLSRQSFYKLINEKSRLVSFKPGQLVMPVHPRSPWSNQMYKAYARKQMSVLEELEDRNTLVFKGLNSDEKDKDTMQMEYNKHVQQKKFNSPHSNKMLEGLKSQILGSMIRGIQEQKDVVAEEKRLGLYKPTTPNDSSPLSSPRRLALKSRQSSNTAGKKMPETDYQRLVSVLSEDQRHETAEALKVALNEKKELAQKKFLLIQRGINIEKYSDYDISQVPLDKILDKRGQIQIRRDERSFCRPIMLLFSGSARCVNHNFTPAASFVAKRLATGSILGESDTIKSVGIDFFGDIYAEDKGLKCLVIEKPDLSLDVYEQEMLKEVLGQSQHELQSMLETRFTQLKQNKIKTY